MKLRIDSKYFTATIAGVSVFLLLVIAVYSVDYSDRQRTLFESTASQRTVLDTLKIQFYGTSEPVVFDSFKGKPLLVVFWAGWSERSISFLDAVVQAHAEAGNPVPLIGGLVKDDITLNESIQKRHPELPVFNATLMYGLLKVPGIPSAILYSADGSVKTIIHGDKRESIPKLFLNE